jgi:D-xylose transport system ATP-binding protein
MLDVLQVSDRIAALFLGQVAGIVERKDVNQQQLVELITTGQSGDLGLSSAAARSAS